MTRMPAPASAPNRPTEIIVSCESRATATPTGARSRRIGAGRMLISTVNITHRAPERTWNAPPETDVACMVASICTTTMTVKRSVGMTREPSSVSTSGIGPARETYSVTLSSSAGVPPYMRGSPPSGSTPWGSSASSQARAVRPDNTRSGAMSHSGRRTNSRS